MSIETEVIELTVKLARFLWHKAHGQDTKPDEATIRQAGLEAAEAAILDASMALEARARELEMHEALIALDKARADLMYELGRVETDPSPDIPQILEGADVREMPAGSTLDADGHWETPGEVPLVDIHSDDIPTKPGGES